MNRHAGYRYSGPPAAFAYTYIDPEPIEKVFILGPSHHFYLTKCALSKCIKYDTPLGKLEVDTETIAELHRTGNFVYMDKEVDEEEHSLEMHLPYVYKVMEKKTGKFKIVPIMVGSLKPEDEKMYGTILSKYLSDPHCFFVVSSDFCHWGKRFQYTPYDSNCGHIHQSIEALDRKAIEIIESIDPPKFSSYLKETKNTICGRHPIGVLLNAVAKLKEEKPENKPQIKFTRYEQSSRVTSLSDSSVSYASAVVYFE